MICTSTTVLIANIQKMATLPATNLMPVALMASAAFRRRSPTAYVDDVGMPLFNRRRTDLEFNIGFFFKSSRRMRTTSSITASSRTLPKHWTRDSCKVSASSPTAAHTTALSPTAHCNLKSQKSFRLTGEPRTTGSWQKTQEAETIKRNTTLLQGSVLAP